MKRFLLTVFAIVMAGLMCPAYAQFGVGPYMQFSSTTPGPEDLCVSGGPAIFAMDTRKFCVCGADGHFACDVTSLDSLILGAVDRNADTGICLTRVALGGRAAVELTACAGGATLPGLLIPPKYFEADKPDCPGSEGVTIYLYPEPGATPPLAGRTVTCLERADSSGSDWILGVLGNSEAP